MSNHTPTPWVATKQFVMDSNGAYLFEPSGKRCLENGSPVPRDLEDAAFIVQAVNAHEDLIQACYLAADHYHSSTDEPICTDNAPCCFCKAIAEAEGHRED